MHGLLEWRRFALQDRAVRSRGIAIEFVHETGGVSRKPIVGAVDVFADVNAAGSQVGQQFFEGHALLFGGMTAIVDNDIERARGLAEVLPKVSTFLVADKNGGVVVLALLNLGMSYADIGTGTSQNFR